MPTKQAIPDGATTTTIRLDHGIRESLRHLLPQLKRETGLPSLHAIMAHAIREIVERHVDELPPELRYEIKFDSMPRAGRI